MIASIAVALMFGAPAPERTYDWMNFQDMEALRSVLRGHVAHLQVETETPEHHLFGGRDGFGVAIEPRLIAANCFIVEKAEKVRIEGPTGTLGGKVVLYDVARRVALIRSDQTLDTIGLFPVKIMPKSERSPAVIVFFIASTLPFSAVVNTWLVKDGPLHEPNGLPRIGMNMEFGMPVFDYKSRLVGYSRAVAWDKDKQLLVPAEAIEEARTATQTGLPPAPKPTFGFTAKPTDPVPLLDLFTP